MFPIYARPKDDSSDDEAYGNHIEVADATILNTESTLCQSGSNDALTITKCHHLRRLVVALKLFESVKDDKLKFERLLIQNYGVRFLDDVHHFFSVHNAETENIKMEMIKNYGFHECNVEECTFTQRHFTSNRRDPTTNCSDVHEDDERDALIKFYRSEYDSLHFNLFHLYQMGYRVSDPQIRAVENNEEQTERKECDDSEHVQDDNGYGCIDEEARRMVSSLRSLRDKHDSLLGRFEKENDNKYSINTDQSYTFTDCILLFMRDQGVSNGTLKALQRLFVDEIYDTDAVKQDISEFVKNDDDYRTSNVYAKTTDLDSMLKIKEYSKSAEENSSTLSTGFVFFYWDYYDPKNGGNLQEMGERRPFAAVNTYSGYSLEELYVEGPKYSNLKEEVLESGLCSIFHFRNYAVLKARKLAQTNSIKAMKAHHYTYSNCHYGIDNGSPITEPHLCSVILYCCFTLFCTAFSATFRRKYFGEPLHSVKERNAAYYFTSKLLRETVELFGTAIYQQKSVSYFCGMDHKMTIAKYMIYLRGPTSTSSTRAVALRFGGEDGILLKLAYKGYCGYGNQLLRFFDCKLLSCFKEEDECLFFGGAWKIRIVSVLVIRTARNYGDFCRVMFLLEAMLNGTSISRSQVSVKPSDGKLLQHLIDYVAGDVAADYNRYDTYIYGCFAAYARNKQSILIFIKHLLDQKFPSYLSNIIMYSVTTRKENETDNILRPIVLKIFPNLRFISIWCNANHSFSLNRFCSLYSEKLLLKHGKIQKLQITAREPRGTWLKSQCEALSTVEPDARYETDFKASLVKARGERDRFVIEKVKR